MSAPASVLRVQARGGAVRFAVHVQPRAKRTEVAGVHGDALRVRLNAPPVDGAANEELIGFLARSLGVPQRAVRIVTGITARAKVVEIEGVEESRIHRLASAVSPR